MEMSKLRHIQQYITSFELDFRRFEYHLQSYQLYIIFTPSMGGISENIETSDIYMNPSHSIIGAIFNSSFGNTLQHQNGPNQRQHTNKNTSQQ